MFIAVRNYNIRGGNMWRYGFLLLILFLYCSDKSVYVSDTFRITDHSIIQNPARAEIQSAHEILSTYKSAYRAPTRNVITFKFSINGLDNERYPGEDHVAFIEPVNGKFTSDIYHFGKPDPESVEIKFEDYSSYLAEDTEVTIRVDMNEVLTAFRTQGFFTTYEGNSIPADDFEGLYIAGGVYPLTWEFTALQKHPEYKMSDPDQDGIYEITLLFPKFRQEEDRGGEPKIWKLTERIESYPQYQSPLPLITALHALSLEEMVLDIRDDGAFMAGAKWPGIWTRDVSYSILLSLAFINPEASKKSLIAKVKNNRIVQDTGTGGSWPISSDRMTWALAAWEVYLFTGDADWLRYSYEVIKNSVDADLYTVFDKSTHLYFGESSFLDWREQTYPRWMDPKDIYGSLNLGTNAVHQHTLEIVAMMADLLGYDSGKYSQMASDVKQAINDRLWIADRGYYGQYLYGRHFKTLSPRSETLGEALCVLFDIADGQQAESIVATMPLLEYGPACIYPQIPSIPPYHNDAIWPFVAGYWTWASAKVKNYPAVEHGLASIYRPAALFLTNKENMVATTGDYLGTETNSDRQLWSVAANLATIYRIIYGMQFTPEGLFLNPFVPPAYAGDHVLSNFTYREAILNIRIMGYGDEIDSTFIDGQFTGEPFISANLMGEHDVLIKLTNKIRDDRTITVVENMISPKTPDLSIDENELRWTPIEAAVKYVVFKNGVRRYELSADTYDYRVETDQFAEYQLMAVDKDGVQSFLSQPVSVIPESDRMIIEPIELAEKGENAIAGHEGRAYIEMSKHENRIITFSVSIRWPGKYAIDFRYANGSGPINTDNKCAIRSLFIDDRRSAAFVFPQRGSGIWDDWGYSNSRVIDLDAGTHRFTLKFTESDENMNVDENTALLDHMRLIMVTAMNR
ncbi:glycogen debranching protein [candidate division KSB1 bacterium]|nr:glycogen debranching protein [candidate division KSB1 bacterium]